MRAKHRMQKWYITTFRKCTWSCCSTLILFFNSYYKDTEVSTKRGLLFLIFSTFRKECTILQIPTYLLYILFSFTITLLKWPLVNWIQFTKWVYLAKRGKLFHFLISEIACPWFTMTKWRFLFIFQIYWLKDRVEVQPERDSNYIQAADGHLIIIQAREKDRANYTCVAENVANRRLSPPARLNVHGKTFSEKKRPSNKGKITFLLPRRK